MSRVIKSIFFIVFLLFFCPTFVFAEDITITTYYPSPFGSYKNLDIYNEDDSNNQTDFTQAVDRAGLLITTDYQNNRYTPGIFWRTHDDNPTRPKAGIYLQERNTGTRMYFGTSNSYATGITNDALMIHESGRVGIGNTNPGYALDVTGQIRMSGATGTKQVVADVAEVIPVADDVEEGDLVCIDDTVQTYQFAKTKTSESPLVAGVISSTKNNSKSIPALFIGDAEQKQKDNPGQKYKYLAVAGQIAVKVCLEGGTIKKGDLLTASSVAGYAMKSQSRQLGTLIGKALEDFDGKDGEKGTIIALVGLM